MMNSPTNNLIFAAEKGTHLSVRLFCSLCMFVILSVYMSSMSVYMLSVSELCTVKGRNVSKGCKMIQFLYLCYSGKVQI